MKFLLLMPAVASLSVSAYAQTPRIDLFPHGALGETVGLYGNGRAATVEERHRGIPVGHIRFDRSNDFRVGSEDREEFSINESGRIAVEDFYSQAGMLNREDVLSRLRFDAACVDPSRVYDLYLEGASQTALARLSLARILDHEAMKRKIEKELPQSRADQAALVALIEVASRNGVLVADESVVPIPGPQGRWTERQIRLLEAQHDADPRIQLARIFGEGSAVAESSGWKGWQVAIPMGYRPCDVRRGQQRLNAPAPAPGSQMCRGMTFHSCSPEATRAAGRNRDGQLCGMSAERFYEFVKNKLNGDNPVPTSFTIDWSDRVALVNTNVIREPGELPLPYEEVPVRNIRYLTGTFADLSQAFREVIQPMHTKLRRKWLWNQLAGQYARTNSTRLSVLRTSQALENAYGSALGRSFVTRQRNISRVFDARFTGANAHQAAERLIELLNPQVSALETVIRTRAEADRCRPITQDEMIRRWGAFETDKTARIRTAVRQASAQFRGVRGNTAESTQVQEDASETIEGDTVSARLRRAAFNVELLQSAIGHEIADISESETVVRFVLELKEEIAESVPFRLENGRVNPQVQDTLRSHMAARSYSLLEREFLKSLFMANPLRLNASSCRAIGVPCVVDSQRFAHILLREELFEGVSLPRDSRGTEIETTLGRPELYDLVQSTNGSELEAAFAAPNESSVDESAEAQE